MSERRIVLLVGDWLIAIAAFLVAGFFRFGRSFIDVWQTSLGLPAVVWIAPLLGGLIVSVAWAVGLYRRNAYWAISAEMGDLVKAYLAALAIVMSVLFFFRLEDFSRLMLMWFAMLMLAGSAALRIAVRHQRGRLRSLRHRTLMLLVGTDGASGILDRFDRHSHLGVEVIGYVGRSNTDVAALERLGDLEDLGHVLAANVVDEVMVCLSVEDWRYLDAITDMCQEQGKAVRVPVASVRNTLHGSTLDELDGIPLLSISAVADRLTGRLAKRLIDLAGSVMLLIIFGPLLVVVAGALFIVQGRPVFYRQARGGVSGRSFSALKFRTMIRDAHEHRHEIAHLNERVGPVFKIGNDPRITPLGRWLRRTSIDELPQLVNVLRGDMSLVGPRPQPVEEIESYDFWHRRRLSMKPGITGLWQVRARNDPNFNQWMTLDLEYIDNWSLWLDIKILLETPIAMARTPGT